MPCIKILQNKTIMKIICQKSVDSSIIKIFINTIINIYSVIILTINNCASILK